MKKKNIQFLDLKKDFEEHEKEYHEALDRVLASGWYILGEEVENFEKEFANYLGVKYCIGVGNGLEALQISLMSLGIKKGDEVITTPLSAVASTLAIMAVGAVPVFIDVDMNGLIDVNLIRAAITKRTKAILPVYLYGQPIDLDNIREICKEYNLFLIEDACQAHGSRYKGKRLGTIGDLGCFSFYPTKNLNAFGDGGAIVTDDPSFANICYQIRDYGQKYRYEHVRYGLNSRLDEIQAAVLRVKLKYLDEINGKRQEIAKRYIQILSKLDDKLEIVKPRFLKECNFHLFVIKTKLRDELKDFLEKRKIATLIHYPKLIPDQDFFYGAYDNCLIENARGFVQRILSLPCHQYMGTEEVENVCEAIDDFFSG